MESPARRRLIPPWAIYVPVGAVLIAAITVFFILSTSRSALVSVPNVTGLDVAVARSRLGEQGLLLAKGDRRFSPDVPVDGVLDQTPAPGVLAPRGTDVTVVLSAGSESFAMPDVTGLPLTTARQSLQDKGLVVQTEVVPSSRAKNVVVSTTPAPGVTVSTADVVKVSVSSGTGGSAGLQPADLTGKVFVIDPAPFSEAAKDTAMEVERRLNSLLEASGAKVFVTRTITDTGTTPAMRALRVKETSATAVLGLDVVSSGPGGLSITTMESLKVPSAAYLGSVQISQALLNTLGAVESGVRSSEVASDPVMQAAGAPGARVTLGSAKDARDIAHFADPTWEDAVARAMYAAVAKVYGSK